MLGMLTNIFKIHIRNQAEHDAFVVNSIKIRDTSQETLRDIGNMLQWSFRIISNYYRITEIRKKDGSSREIQAPVPSLKEYQRVLLQELNKRFKLSDNSTAVKGKNFISNATVHAGAKHVLRVDIKSFYPSCKASKVIDVVRTYFPKQAEWFIGAVPLMFYHDLEATLSEHTNMFLATGAPTSPFLGNLVLIPLDEKVVIFLKDYPDAIYTRYLDDLTISFKQDIDPEKMNEIRHGVFSMLTSEGWIPHPRKSRWINPIHDKVTVTGVDIRGEPKVTTLYIKNKLKPKIEKSIKNIFQRNFTLPKFTRDRRQSDINTFEDVLPIFFQDVLPTLNYIKLVNLQQYQKLIDHLKTRINRHFTLMYGAPHPTTVHQFCINTRTHNRIYIGDQGQSPQNLDVVYTPIDALIYSLKSLLRK